MSIDSPPPPDALDIREQAVHEERVWVRTTFACNNRCIFCLDGDVPPHGHRLKDAVLEEIRARFTPGARLIVSGGEASIHPDFLEFVRAGRECGYAWIQTITNGRMFAYAEFARQAVENGLTEATFSMHGHTRELHDTLTGVAGGFVQAIRGMTNLMKAGIVVNVDVVINGLNYKHLDDILAFYMRLGIHEFDLLQVAPFGRAWWPENRERMFYDVAEGFPYLNTAFRRARLPGVYLWTNRFPVAYLEGLEDLIQDPHKLFDEMRGRREEFERFLDTGQMLPCWPERCPHCFLKDYCAGLVALRERLATRNYSVLDVDLREGDGEKSPELLARLLPDAPLRQLRLAARDLTEALDWLNRNDALRAPVALYLSDWTAFLAASSRASLPDGLSAVTTLVCEDVASFDALLTLDADLEWRVTKDNANLLAFRRDDLIARGRVMLRYPSVETLTEARRLLPDPAGFFAPWRDAPVRVTGVPVCVHPRAEAEPVTLHASSLDAAGRIDMARYTRDFIRRDYRAHSNRCTACPARSGCPGLHLNTLRVHGFAVLKPEKAGNEK